VESARADHERLRRDRQGGHLMADHWRQWHLGWTPSQMHYPLPTSRDVPLPHTFKFEGWRWEITLAFLRSYFHKQFIGLFTARTPASAHAHAQAPPHTQASCAHITPVTGRCTGSSAVQEVYEAAPNRRRDQ
jgi:hypothetical protein